MSNLHLFELIKNLSQSEKRYFKLYLKRYSDANTESNYAKLFDYLSIQESVSNDGLLKDCSFIKKRQLPNIKSRLYNYVMNSLRSYNSNKNITQKYEIYKNLSNYEILIKKSLFNQAKQMLNRARQIAESTDALGLEYDILKDENYLYNSKYKGASTKKLSILTNDRLSNSYSKIVLYTRLQSIFQNQYLIHKQEGRICRDITLLVPITNSLNNISTEIETLHKESHAINFQYGTNRILLNVMKAEWSNAAKLSKILFNEMINPKKSLNYENIRRLVILCIISHIKCGDYNAAQNYIDYLADNENRYQEDKGVKVDVFEDVFFFTLEKLISQNQIIDAVQWIEDNSSKIESMDSSLHNVNQQSKRYRIALTYFLSNKYDDALTWINRIIINEKLKYRKDILCSVQILNILIHFKLENELLVRSKLTTLISHLKKNDRYLAPEKLLIKYLQDCINTNQSRILLTERLHSELERLFDRNHLDKYFVSYMDVLYWLELQKVELCQI